MPFGSVLPEGSSFEWGVPIYGLGGRGLAANLMLYYNSRVWSRRGTTMAYDAISGWPAPGFSLGFGRIVPYEIGSGGNPTCKYLLIERDGTRRYLGSGLYNGYGYAAGGPFETSDGSHIVYTGNARDGGDLHYPDGTTGSLTRQPTTACCQPLSLTGMAIMCRSPGSQTALRATADTSRPSHLIM